MPPPTDSYFHRRRGEWLCERCNSINHETDSECQWCDFYISDDQYERDAEDAQRIADAREGFDE